MKHPNLVAVLATGILSFACNDSVLTGPSKPSQYGNPELRLPPPVFRINPSAELVVSPSNGAQIKVNEYFRLKVRFSLPPEMYPNYVGISLFWKLADGRSVGQGCTGYYHGLRNSWQPSDELTVDCKLTDFTVKDFPPDGSIDVDFVVLSQDFSKYYFYKSFDTNFVLVR